MPPPCATPHMGDSGRVTTLRIYREADIGSNNRDQGIMSCDVTDLARPPAACAGPRSVHAGLLATSGASRAE